LQFQEITNFDLVFSHTILFISKGWKRLKLSRCLVIGILMVLMFEGVSCGATHFDGTVVGKWGVPWYPLLKMRGHLG
jgi:uncharacterized membrane protein YagU involved in acid resistance